MLFLHPQCRDQRGCFGRGLCWYLQEVRNLFLSLTGSFPHRCPRGEPAAALCPAAVPQHHTGDVLPAAGGAAPDRDVREQHRCLTAGGQRSAGHWAQGTDHGTLTTGLCCRALLSWFASKGEGDYPHDTVTAEGVVPSSLSVGLYPLGSIQKSKLFVS